MGTQIKVWEVTQSNLVPVDRLLREEERKEFDLEKWICGSPDLLGEDLLIIAKQLRIDETRRLDLLGIDESGQLVIIEIKRDRGPREAVAQALDYASWLNTAGEDAISLAANEYLNRDLQDAFEKRFEVELPDLLCENHRILIVAAELDSSAERIIDYLADKHNVPINAVFFNYAKLSDGKEILVRSILVSESLTRTGNRSRPSEDELLSIARERKNDALVEACRKVGRMWKEIPTNTAGKSFRYLATRADGRRPVVFGVNVSGGLADSPVGQLDVWLNTDTLADVVGVSEESIRRDFSSIKPPFKSGKMDFILRLGTVQEAEQLVQKLSGLMKNSTHLVSR